MATPLKASQKGNRKGNGRGGRGKTGGGKKVTPSKNRTPSTPTEAAPGGGGGGAGGRRRNKNRGGKKAKGLAQGQAQPRQSKAATSGDGTLGQDRALVPFFMPGSDQVNEGLNVYAPAPGGMPHAAAPPVPGMLRVPGGVTPMAPGGAAPSHERWAGAQFQRSPDPTSVPLPSFLNSPSTTPAMSFAPAPAPAPAAAAVPAPVPGPWAVPGTTPPPAHNAAAAGAVLLAMLQNGAAAGASVPGAVPVHTPPPAMGSHEQMATSNLKAMLQIGQHA